jgi:hypothetical protein
VSAKRLVGLGLGAGGLLALPLASELRVRGSALPLTDAWRNLPIERRGTTKLGISFRPPQAEALGLAARASLEDLVGYPFELIRLGAYWNRLEPVPGAFETAELDWQVDTAARAGKQIILAVGAIKTFSYPEFYVPDHRLAAPLAEGTLISPVSHPALLAAATEFVAKVVDRYRSNTAIVGWQVEHEAVDPLGIEHSWRLARSFVAAEVQTVRRIDPSRPIILNGFVPSALLGRLSQWLQTRDQGDSLAVARQLADVVGIDYYPRYALARLGTRSVYLDGTASPWQRGRPQRLLRAIVGSGRPVMVTEGQAEPWEAVTLAPNPPGRVMASCPPEQLIRTYNTWLRAADPSAALSAYLFWGAEYWLLRAQSEDPSYLNAFRRILEEA